MSVFDLFQGGVDPVPGSLDAVAARVLRHQTQGALVGEAFERFFPDERSRLAIEGSKLDNQLKRRALKAPLDDDDYQQAVNEDRPFEQKGALAIFGHHVSKVVPEPMLLEPKRAQTWANAMRGATTEGSSLSSIARNLAHGAATYATPFRRLFR